MARIWNRVSVAALTAVSAAAVVLGITSAPSATADPGVGAAGLDAEGEYLTFLEDRGFEFTRANVVDTVKVGYLLCLLRQLGGATPDGMGSEMKAANRYLCDAMPPLPPTQREQALDIVTRDVTMDQLRDVNETIADIDDLVDVDYDEDGITNNRDSTPEG